MSLHAWHKRATARTPIVLVAPSRTVNGLTFPEVVSGGERLPNGGLSEPDGSIHRGTLRSAVAQRARNAMTLDELAVLRKRWDASPEAKALAEEHAKRPVVSVFSTGNDGKVHTSEVPFASHDVAEHERVEHFELWVLRELHDHESMPAESELALEKLLQHHAHPHKIAAHKQRVVEAGQ